MAAKKKSTKSIKEPSKRERDALEKLVEINLRQGKTPLISPKR